MIDLSVLICSTHTRYQTFGPKIQEQVWTQYNLLDPSDQDRVEIMILTDNKKIMLGEKRNIMVDAAQGRYVHFIDDDDRIAPDMFNSLLDAIETNADVITFDASVSINGESPKTCHYGIKYGKDYNTTNEYFRIPNHICCTKRELMLEVSFPNVLYGEDSGYSKLLLPHLKTEAHIDKVLYFYDYSDETTETQLHRKAAIRRRPVEPIVDVVILSNAKNSQMHSMTQKAIDTCIAGANLLPVNITVIEQNFNAKYRNSSVVYNDQQFNYNRFANQGAARGTADWIMIANNDLAFRDGWLHQLLIANHPVMSPKCPADRRQMNITSNTVGDQNGMHFSGWCFMIKRSLWEQIGGFDDCVDFWCSDDVTIEQVKAAGIMPMLVPSSLVRHLGSVTLNSDQRIDDLTWKQVDIFNRKYGKNKFEDDVRYQSWKDKNKRQEVS